LKKQSSQLGGKDIQTIFAMELDSGYLFRLYNKNAGTVPEVFHVPCTKIWIKSDRAQGSLGYWISRKDPAVCLQPSGRHISAGVLKPPESGTSTTPPLLFAMRQYRSSAQSAMKKLGNCPRYFLSPTITCTG
jgi:hypothetical protein